jgi:8-oxo-dGTP pyrophosphatase MutT (NUDIX family)
LRRRRRSSVHGDAVVADPNTLSGVTMGADAGFADDTTTTTLGRHAGSTMPSKLSPLHVARRYQRICCSSNPTYKPDWDLPGGMAEANEAPIDAARHELREELGLTVEIATLLCVDWIPPHGPWDDTVVFVFDGGNLSPDAVAAMEVRDDELSAFRFCSPDEAAQLLRPYVWRCAATALDARRAGCALYLHYRAAAI